jgi:hypothetical protein
MSQFKFVQTSTFYFLLFCCTCVRALEQDNHPTQEPITQFVLHNKYKTNGSKGKKEMRARFTFNYKYGELGGGQTNIYTLKPGEKRTFVISELELRHPYSEQRVKIQEVNSNGLNILLTWPSVGKIFEVQPEESYDPKRLCVSPFIDPAKPWMGKKKAEEWKVPDHSQECSQYLNLTRGIYLTILPDNTYYDNGPNPIARIYQSKSKDSKYPPS